MAKANVDWKVLPHGPIEKVAENLWRVEGGLEGIPLKRVMTIVKLASGGLVVHNAMSLEESAMKEIEAWGPVEHVIVPNGFHRLDAPAWKKRYPDARFYCPGGGRAKVEEVVKVDGKLEDLPKSDGFSVETLEGTKGGEGVVTVRSKDGATLVFNDAIFNMPHFGGFQGWVFKHVTLSSGGPRVSRIGRFFLVKDKAAFKAHLERLAETEGLVRVIVSHHEMITESPAEAVRGAAATV